MIHNVFLDFLNRDSRQIYGLFSNVPDATHVELLNEGINVAVFLCADYCIMAPGFLAEDVLVQKAMARCETYTHERIIRMPIREESLESFFDKKLREYAPFRADYANLFDQDVQELIKKHSIALTSRTSSVAREIIDQWERGPDEGGIWRNFTDRIQPRELERIRRVPRSIYQTGIAVTWRSMVELLDNKSGVDLRQLRAILQNHYFSVYMREFDLRVVTNLPFSRSSFSLGSGDLTYDYEALKSALAAAGLWELVLSMSAPSMIALRQTSGYYIFRDIFDELARRCSTARDIGRVVARIRHNSRAIYNETRILDRYSRPSGIAMLYGLMLSHDEVEAISARLEAVSMNAIELADAVEDDRRRQAESAARQFAKTTAPTRKVAVYVALEEERAILMRDLNLISRYPDIGFEGKLGQVDILVFGRDEMGRVPAAVETMRLFQQEKPDFLIVAGIAGGFASEGCGLGDIIVATEVVDLATRKVRQKDSSMPEPQFRPTVFPTDERIGRYLRFAFNKRSWQQEIVDKADWPRGRHPEIYYGSISSMDEVVASTAWVDRLLEAFPKLLGIEMEAGGVCAAAAAHNMRAAVIRGISDLAGPTKSDDEWRTRAMRTVTHLLRNIDFASIPLSGGG
jgi:nucleoside phosphorylase